MLNFRFDMPLYLMALYGSIMILAVLLLHGLLHKKLPKFVFPILWSVVLLRLLLPFSISSPISLPVPSIAFFDNLENVAENLAFVEETTNVSSEVAEDTSQSLMDSNIPSGAISEYTASNVDSLTEDTIVMECTAYEAGISSISSPTHTIFFCVYILGIAITFGVLLFQKLHYTKKLKNRLLLEHNESINDILREMNVGQILVFSNDEIASPMVCGLLHPCIYLPTRMDFGNTQLLRHILTHETMHIKRKDNWLKALMLAALCINSSWTHFSLG